MILRGHAKKIPVFAAGFFFLIASCMAAPGINRSKIDFMSARGLDYLKRAQRIDGVFSKSKFQVACQAFAGLAFLSCGYTPKHGEYAIQIRLGLRRLLEYQEPGGYFNDKASMMYGHGLAALYLAEVLGMWGVPEEEKKLRESLRKAIHLIELSQGGSGGWGYNPRFEGSSDCSITVCQTMALRAARNIGFSVDKNVITKALKYIRSAQAPSGGFRYRIGGNAPPMLRQVTLGCSAAGVCILNGLGEYETQNVHRGLDYLKRHYRAVPDIRFYFYYTHYYAAQAFFRVGSSTWEDYYNFVAEELLKRQQKDGAWRFQTASFLKLGTKEPVIATSMAVFILNVPRAILPIIEK